MASPTATTTLSFDDANALLAPIPEGSKFVVSGRQSDSFTEEQGCAIS
jgi:hypothetical protein